MMPASTTVTRPARALRNTAYPVRCNPGSIPATIMSKV
jgi:hypothetical protein